MFGVYKSNNYEKPKTWDQMFFSIEQVKAARALLKWNQKDLAKHAGLKDDQIYNYESGRSRAPEILESIFKAFTREGLLFVDEGVIRKRVKFYVLDTYLDLLDDIAARLPEGGEVLFHCADDRRSSDAVRARLGQLQSMGIRFRSTISDANDYIDGKPQDYRQIPADYFNECQISAIYEDHFMQHVPGENHKGGFLVMKSRPHAEEMRRQFEYWWKTGKKLERK